MRDCRCGCTDTDLCLRDTWRCGPPASWAADICTLQLLYILTFWLLLRRFVKEKLLRKARAPAVLLEVAVAEAGEWRAETGDPAPEASPCNCEPLLPAAEPTQTQTLLRSLGELVTGIYAKYWIYVCAGMFIVVSFAGRLVVYKIVYMFLFLLCLTLFQVGGGALPQGWG